ncbi:hypothetical protein [Hymenobacter edaphi]|uniref:hypothetical protein n=1 Tax=Hymenobacter edaphi TaxID=2211146 RepID=UPI001057ED8C|nr:hypothetical protein [Hymenobacter edaphi]
MDFFMRKYVGIFGTLAQSFVKKANTNDCVLGQKKTEKPRQKSGSLKPKLLFWRFDGFLRVVSGASEW